MLWWLLGFVCLLIVMVIGRGMFGGFLLGGRLYGLLRFKFFGMGFLWLGDLFLRVYFSGGFVMKIKEWLCICKEILRLIKMIIIIGGIRDVCFLKVRKIIRIKEVSL